MDNVEYEFKQLITLEEYNILSSKLDEIADCNEFIQINYYFDDNSFTLFSRNETLRVRQRLGKLTLERKHNKRYCSTGERICDENSNTISFLPAEVSIDGHTYHYVGDLVTLRKNFIIDNDIISLDMNFYLGKTDYELEIESNREIKLLEFITELIDFKIYQDSKYTRFVKNLKKTGLLDAKV